MCRWCAEVGAPSPIASWRADGNALAELERGASVERTRLRRVAVGEGAALSVSEAHRVAIVLGCRIGDLDLELASERARARRAAARRRAEGASQ
jgi:hypothetical protein